MQVAEQWRNLYEQHGPALLLYARQWAESLSDAEDVVHDAFVNMIRKSATPQDPTAYLFAAVRNAALDQKRSAARRRSRECSAIADRPLFQSETMTIDERESLELALTALPEPQREVLVMKIWGELTFQAIGHVLNLSSNTVASRYRYALEALRKTLDLEPGKEIVQ